LQHSALWDLPRGMYWVCGYNAYKWLPVGVKGSCTLARLTPATFIVPYDQLDAQVLPKHMIFKRAADNKPRESGRPHVVQMGTANKIFSTFFLYPMIMQMWDKLVESTDYLDDQIFAVLDIVNTSVAVQQQLIIVTNQHTLVLDYLTAAQGGMCQIIGPACCHYIDPKGQLQLRAKLNDIQKLRDKYQKDNDVNKDSWWANTFSFLNPANWFKGIFVDLVHRLVLQHSALWDLPRGMYWVCGYNAYKWLPVGVKGSCTLARLTPATFIVPYDQLDAQVLPKHMIFKRAADNKPRESGRPHVVQMGTANKIFSTFFLYPMIMQMWDKLVESTDYLDDQIFAVLDIVNTSVAVQQQLIIVTNQHTLVLDYLTAAQGGMCQIIGPACCHYIDPKGQLQLRAKLNDIQKLRDKYQKDNDVNKDSWWANTFSFLNPANWFKGIFVDLVHRLVLQHSALWDLPRGMYWVCGYNAYKWLPVGVKGSCTLARLTPATFIVPYDQLDAQVLPKHMIFKRAADNKPRESGRPHVVQMGTANKIFSTFFLYPMIMQMWDKLVESTDYLDDQIFAVLDIVNTSVAVQQQLIIVTNQHTLVLDYLTAAQGGMCQIIGPACCHYIDPKGQLQLRAKLNDIQKLRDKYQKDNDVNKDSWWANT
ncbi:uncharacterized protein ACNLHF_004817, partial [Anomaloglossus baeobatrachus]